MYNSTYSFGSKWGASVVSTPTDIDLIIESWGKLRTKMIRTMPPDFEREEWAYVIQFLGPSILNRVISQTFGDKLGTIKEAERMYRPRGTVAVWLPNNVSLLGPLLLVLISLSGNKAIFKSGTRSKNLTQSFLDYGLDYLPDEPLKDYLLQNVQLFHFDRADKKNEEMSKGADVRIFFGSDAAAKSIQKLKRQIHTLDFFFTDKQSELWMHPSNIDDDMIVDLIKVFAVYGQAGCTSPKCVYLIDGCEKDAVRIRNRIVHLWSRVFKEQPPQHIASSVTLDEQMAKTQNWSTVVVPNRGAVIASGPVSNSVPEANMFLPITWQSIVERIESMPENIQTIGYAGLNLHTKEWQESLTKLTAKRIVPLKEMHHFGPTWDGYGFWRQLFEEVELKRQR